MQRYGMKPKDPREDALTGMYMGETGQHKDPRMAALEALSDPIGPDDDDDSAEFAAPRRR